MQTNLSDFFQHHDKGQIEAMCRETLDNGNVDLYSAFALARLKTIEYAKSRGRRYITRNSMPMQMYDNMVGTLYDLHGDLMREDSERCPYLLLRRDLRVYPKKLDENYLPGNIVTKHVKKKRGQELYAEGEGKIHVLYAGPVLINNDWLRDFKGYYATYVNEYYPKWPKFIIGLEKYIKTVAIPAAVEAAAEPNLLVKPKTGTEGADVAQAK